MEDKGKKAWVWHVSSSQCSLLYISYEFPNMLFPVTRGAQVSVFTPSCGMWDVPLEGLKICPTSQASGAARIELRSGPIRAICGSSHPQRKYEIMET